MSVKLILIKKSSDFDKSRFKQKPYSNDLTRLRLAFGVNQNLPRFGFIVPKKNVKKVVVRNRIKRRLKAILAKHLGSIKPADVLFFPNSNVALKPFPYVEEQITRLLKIAKLWK